MIYTNISNNSMESEDEDVIFENSVLHQALTNIGVTNIKTEPRLLIEIAEKETNLVRNIRSLPHAINAKRLYRLHSDIIPRIFYSSKILEEVHSYYRYQTLMWLLSSDLLLEDDQLFLQSYVEEEGSTRDPLKCLSLYSFNLLCFLTTSIILVSFVFPVNVVSSWVIFCVDIMPQVLSGFEVYISAILLTLLWVLCFALPILVLKRRVCHQVISQMQKQDKCVKDLVKEAVELLLLEKKCLRLIKESELVARGFTLTNQHHVVSRASQGLASISSDQLCPGLRHIMFSENSKVMQEVKMWVVKMLRGVPMICVDSDFSTLEDLHLNESNPTTDAAVKADNIETYGIDHITEKKSGTGCIHGDILISPSELCRSVELLNVYLSGFVRRLALCFYPQNLRDRTINPYVATHECTEMSKKVIERTRALIKQSYAFYRAVHQYDRNEAVQPVQPSKQNVRSQTHNLYVCVNSLDLHLQSLLNITRNMTLTLEDRVDKEQHRLTGTSIESSNEHNSNSEDDKSLWEDTLKRIKSGLESCRSCYEESLKHLHQITNIDTTAGDLPVKAASPDTVQSSTQINITWIPAEDPIIVDQVFEAINDTTEEDDFSETRPHYNTEDRARHQEEKEAIRRFRQELHSVIGHRAILSKAREERALARARGEVINSLETSLEPSVISIPVDTEIFPHSVEANCGFINNSVQISPNLIEKVQPTEGVCAREQHLGVKCLTQAADMGPNITHQEESTEVEPSIAHKVASAESIITHQKESSAVEPSITNKTESLAVEPKLISSVHTKRMQHNKTLDGTVKISHISLDFENKSTSQQPYQSDLEEDVSSCLSATRDDAISTSITGEEMLLGHKYCTDPHIQCVTVKTHSSTLIKTEICGDSQYGFVQNMNYVVGDSGDKIDMYNGKISSVTLFDNSQPHSQVNTNCNSLSQDSVLGSDSYLSHSYRIKGDVSGSFLNTSDKIEGDDSGSFLNTSDKIRGDVSGSFLNTSDRVERNYSESAEAKDSKNRPILLHYATDELPDSFGQSFLHHEDVTKQKSCASPEVIISQNNSTNVSRSRIQIPRQDLDHKFNGADGHTVPSMSNWNFTKSIAMMAASQARTLVEEQFGDESWDSENSNSEDDIVHTMD